jgi:hypothetical protein
MANEAANPGSDAVAYSTDVPPTSLSVAVHEVRIRLSRDDIYTALGPVSRHAEAALICLQLDDDEGLEHHLRRVVDGVRQAALKYRELKDLLSLPAPTEAAA